MIGHGRIVPAGDDYNKHLFEKCRLEHYLEDGDGSRLILFMLADVFNYIHLDIRSILNQLNV